jgi:Domain of unknown function (DUF1992)
MFGRCARRAIYNDGVDIWQTIAERKIVEAQEEGKFENLRGRGQPLDLREDPFEDPAMRLAHQLLRHNGVSLPWIEERKWLERECLALRTQQARVAKRDRRVESSLGERMAQLNGLITEYNLKAPSPRFHLPLLEDQG